MIPRLIDTNQGLKIPSHGGSVVGKISVGSLGRNRWNYFCDNGRVQVNRGVTLARLGARKVPREIVSWHPPTMVYLARVSFKKSKYSKDQHQRNEKGVPGLEDDVFWTATPNLSFFRKVTGRS